MNELQIFSNPEFGEIRTMEINGETWFVGRDVAAALGYKEPTKAARERVDEEDRGVSKIGTPSGAQDVTIINEGGLYCLVLSSKLPAAKKFRRWVTSEVLPSIRRSGGYISGQDELSPEDLMAKALMVAQRMLAEREARLKTQAVEICALTVDKQIMQPKAEYFDDLVDRNLLTNFTEAAKQIGVKRKTLIGFMIDHGYLYRDKKGNLLPLRKQKDRGTI